MSSLTAAENRTCQGKISNKKAPRKVLFIKWCAIVCDYQTNYPQKYNTQRVNIDNLAVNLFSTI